MEPEEYTIELDCWPGTPRPDTLLPGVLENTGVEIEPTDTASRFFGNYMWVVPEDQVEAFLAHRDTIARRIKSLHHNGAIRYGSW